MQLAFEQDQLRRADERIALATARIARQTELVRTLTREGRDATEAQRLLSLLRVTLDTMMGYRGVVVEHIIRLERRRCESD